jgi:heme-degrading monooxygenase HmoA
MFARITTLSGVTRIDAGVEHLRTSVVPQLQQQRGYRGLHASGDRAAGFVSVLTLWDTKDDLDASESAVEKLRQDAVMAFGGDSPMVERYEQTVAEIGPKPPTVGSRLLVRRVMMEPGRVDDNVAFFKSTVLPEIMSKPGFQSIRQMINRATGEGVVGTIWTDQDSLQAADAQMEQQRALAASRGVEFGEVSAGEVLLAAF